MEEGSELGVRLKLIATQDSIPIDHLITHLDRDGIDLRARVTGKAEHKVEMVTENLFCHLAVIDRHPWNPDNSMCPENGVSGLKSQPLLRCHLHPTLLQIRQSEPRRWVENFWNLSPMPGPMEAPPSLPA